MQAIAHKTTSKLEPLVAEMNRVSHLPLFDLTPNQMKERVRIACKTAQSYIDESKQRINNNSWDGVLTFTLDNVASAHKEGNRG